MRNRRLRNALSAALAGLSVGVLAVGCSSSSPPANTSSNVAASTLSGIYVTNSAGGIQQFEFVDSSHVNVWWAHCANGKPCEANDTYTRSGDQLVISEPGGNTTKIILSGIETGVGTTYDPLHPLGGVSLGGGGVSLGGSSDAGTSLTASADASLTTGVTITIVITFTITIVIEQGDAGLPLVGEGGATGDGGVNLASDGAVLTSDGDVLTDDEGGASDDDGGASDGDGGASDSDGGTSDGAASGSGSGSGSSSGRGSSSASGSTGAGGSSATSTSSSSSASSSSQQAICSNVTQQTFKSASTFPNDKTSFDYLLSQGLNATQAAGVVGNLDQESGDSPTCYQGPNGCSSTPISGYPGAGIAQWSVGGRWDHDSNDNAKAYAQQEGESVTSLQLQLQFLWYELSNFSQYGLSSLQQQTSVSGATQVFASDFEACGTCVQTNRVKYGQNAYNAFSSDQVSSSADAGMCVQNYGTCSANGSSGSCIDTGSCSSRGGTSSAGLCPGPSNIQCCTQ